MSNMVNYLGICVCVCVCVWVCVCVVLIHIKCFYSRLILNLDCYAPPPSPRDSTFMYLLSIHWQVLQFHLSQIWPAVTDTAIISSRNSTALDWPLLAQTAFAQWVKAWRGSHPTAELCPSHCIWSPKACPHLKVGLALHRSQESHKSSSFFASFVSSQVLQQSYCASNLSWLCSCSCFLGSSLQIPHSRLSAVGSSAFSVFGPSTSNELPLRVWQKPFLDSFRSNLETCLFLKQQTCHDFCSALLSSSTSSLSLLFV